MEAPHTADPIDGAEGFVELGLDRVLGVVVELEAVGAEQLDAIILVGIVRGRDHHGQLEAMALEE